MFPAYTRNTSRRLFGSASVCGAANRTKSPAIPYMPVSLMGAGHGIMLGVRSGSDSQVAHSRRATMRGPEGDLAYRDCELDSRFGLDLRFVAVEELHWS